MALANKFAHPMEFTGDYLDGYWAGYRFKDPPSGGGLHTGLDYNWGGPGEDCGMDIRSIANGVVVASAFNGFGQTLIIRHEIPSHIAKAIGATKYVYSRYMHMIKGSQLVKVGDTVQIGQKIGLCGATGTNACHLHLDIWSDINGLGAHMEYHKWTRLESYLDPYKFIEKYKSDTSPKPTPAPDPQLKDYQRITTSDMNYRRDPNTSRAPIEVFPKDEILDFDGWIEGESVDGNNVWFRGRYTSGFVWSGGLNSASTKGLVDLNPQTPKPPTPQPPVPPEDNKLPLDTVVNKKNPISPIDYEPNYLVDVGGQLMEKTAGEAMYSMIKAAALDGVTLTPSSGYRSYGTQTQVYNKWVSQLGQEEADRVSARPGHSEHQMGGTMDFGSITPSFVDTDAFAWMKLNGHLYGFILRYPSGKEHITGYNFEPWHWRFVGVAAATRIQATGVTLEEYYGIEGGLYPGQDPVVPPTVPEVPPVTEPEVPEVPPVIPPEVEKPPKDPTKETLLEAARLAVLAIVSALLTAGLDFLLGFVAGLGIPPEIALQVTTFFTIAFRLLDKFAYMKLKQAEAYALSNWAKIWTKFKLPF